MSDKFKTTLIGAAALAFLTPLSAVVLAAPADHTPYSHALGDLRLAKTALRHQAGEPAASAQETAAVKEINKAIGELTQIVSGHGAKGSDDMNIGEGASGEGPAGDIAVAPTAGNTKPDAHVDHGSRLRDAQEALRKAKADIDGQTDSTTKAERSRITAHIDAALQSVQQAGTN